VAHRILVVDDDPHIRDIICFALEKAGLTTVVAHDGAQAVAKFRSHAPDLLVLDVGMPEMDGLEVCRRIRQTSDVPILFLSARDEDIDRILGLELGGDDYVTKPFSPRELIARIKAILKRTRAPRPVAEQVLTQGALRLEPDAHEVTFDGRPVPLTANEFAILHTLIARPRAVFSREQILNASRGGAVYVSDRTTDSHIRNIRAKLAAIGCADAIETVHGVGFRIGRCEATA
jgi:two-component system, OmpR family, response regulator